MSQRQGCSSSATGTGAGFPPPVPAMLRKGSACTLPTATSPWVGGRADQEGDDAPAGSSEITGVAAAGQLEGADSAALATGPVAAASS